jgi:putative ABC transport system ATP-binding protein
MTAAALIYDLENVTKQLEKRVRASHSAFPGSPCDVVSLSHSSARAAAAKRPCSIYLGSFRLQTQLIRFDLHFHDGESETVTKAAESRLAELRRRHLGYVLQSGGLLPFLTVGDNILLARRANSLGKPEEAKIVAEQLGVAGLWRKKPAFLSGGQRQRLAIARALAHIPAVVLADEPTGGVDRVTAQEIRNLLRDAARARGATVLVVTHDEPLVADITDRVFSFRVEKPMPDRVESTLVETAWRERRVEGERP